MKIGVRGSKLALEYASRAAALINNAEIVTVTTEAEINPDDKPAIILDKRLNFFLELMILLELSNR